MGLTHVDRLRTVIGNKRLVISEATFDSSYPTGGESCTPADLGLNTIESLVVLGASGVAAAGRFFQWDATNKKILAFNPVTAHTHVAGAITVDSHTHTAGAITVDPHIHGVTTYSDTPITATAAAAAPGGTVATAASAATAAATAGAATEVAASASLSTVVVTILAIGV